MPHLDSRGAEGTPGGSSGQLLRGRALADSYSGNALDEMSEASDVRRDRVRGSETEEMERLKKSEWQVNYTLGCY